MKIYYTFFLLLIIFCTSAQEIIDKEALKKCKKEFSKKICLSDEDGDTVLFYLDQCPKESGVVENNGCPWQNIDGDEVIDKDDACPTVAGPPENNGCPWPDTDGDGILDKDDSCPTAEGLVENNGCPIQKLDCTKFYEEENLKYEKFIIDNKNIESIYNSLSINILNYFKKENKNVKIREVYLDFLDYGPQCMYYPRGYVPQCNSNRSRNEYNFLVTRFWNKNALENFVSKNNASIRMKYYFQNYEDSFNGILPKELHDFLVKRKVSDSRVIISPKGIDRINSKISLEIKIRFISPYQLMINFNPFDGGVYPVSKKLEYQNGKWIELKE